MRRCPYCGKQYPDNADTCTVDQQTLEDPAATPRRVVQTGAPERPDFNARVISHGVALAVYRVYLRGQDLVFVQEGKAKVNRGVELVAGLLGPVGSLVGFAYRVWSKRKGETAQAHDEGGGQENALRADGSDFSIHVPEIRDATLEPPGRLALAGERAGRLDLLVRDGKRMRLELPSTDDVKSVLDLLPPLLKSTFRVNVEWDESGHRFQRKQNTVRFLVI